ncbi:sensor histidine kinase [Streptoalloteichus hindustanus]|uniref:histidine kinase n=1 Tax=Streptoalloteichus hindustanus TaxID=2017 RepID=A0A1M5QBM9_STRHI|nr:sensor histidine kinase [Streptoalloteichus hindustanus]SHH11330.1 Signal transduction histidine kinase [Streptoalloteichus hindustanus]
MSAALPTQSTAPTASSGSSAPPQPLVVDIGRWLAGAGARLLRAPFHRRAGAEFLYLVIGVPLAVLGFGYALLTVGLGLVTGITSLGMPLLSAGVRGARRLGGVHRGLARRLLGVSVAPPRPLVGGRGFLGWVGAGLRDTAGWRAMAYLAVKLPVALVMIALSVVFWGYGLFFTSYLGWWWLLPDGQRLGLPWASTEVDSWPKALALAGVGAVLLLAAPWVTRGVLVLDRVPLRGLLGPTTLSERVRDLEEARSHAVEDAAAKLRRIERDLHDGTQARLVALAMKLGMAKEALDSAASDTAALDTAAPDTEALGTAAPGTEGGRTDLAQARLLVDHAHRGLKDALTELRDLVRGIHPPVLDSGLDVALATLAADSALPVQLRVEVPDRPSAAIETIAYFCVAELLTNVAKHSGARRAAVDVAQRDGLLRVRVEDDGVGGAAPGGSGSGLAGLADRARTVDGRIQVDSPVGGPTVVTVELPSHT